MLFGTLFGFTTSAGALYQAHWIGLAVTGLGLFLTTGLLSWSAEQRRGYGPVLLVATAAPLLLANPAVALLEDFGVVHRQLLALKEQILLLTIMGQAALVAAVFWNASWDVKAKMLCSRLFAPRPAAGGVAKLVPEATGTP